MGAKYKKQYEESLKLFIKQAHFNDSAYPLVHIVAAGYQQEFSPKLKTLRKAEYSSVILQAKDGKEFIAAFSTKAYVRAEATINMIRTSFLILVLGASSILFTRDAQILVLDPLERMIEKVKLIAKNPLIAASEEVNEAGLMTFIEKEDRDDQEIDREED